MSLINNKIRFILQIVSIVKKNNTYEMLGYFN